MKDEIVNLENWIYDNWENKNIYDNACIKRTKELLEFGKSSDMMNIYVSYIWLTNGVHTQETSS